MYSLRGTQKHSEDLASSEAQCLLLLLVSVDLRNFQEVIKIQGFAHMTSKFYYFLSIKS